VIEMRSIVVDVFIAILIVLISFTWTLIPAKQKQNLFCFQCKRQMPIQKYENALDVEQINTVMRQMTVITTKAEVIIEGDLGENPKTRETEMEAIAIYISDKYIVAETHATQVSNEKIIRTPFGMFFLQQKVVSEKFFIDDREIQLIGRHRDISLFEDTEPYTGKIIPFGNSDELEIGTRVIIVGWSLGKGINTKDGIVSMFITDDQFNPPGDTIKDISFMLTVPVNPGDSGSPVLAIRGGKYEIVGLTCAMGVGNGLGFAFYGNFVKDSVKLIMETSNVL
jgi:S1-C subfamily serine protease